MKKYINIKKIILLCGVLLLCVPAVVSSADKKEYFRFVVLSDMHLPVKKTEITDPKKQEKIIKAKHRIINTINSWKDNDRIIVTGDLVGDNGVESEYQYVTDYLKKYKAPVWIIGGNHDYTYDDTLKEDGKLKNGTPESRKEKLDKILITYKMPSLLYTEKVKGYLLVFITVDEVNPKYTVQMSRQNLDNFRKVLEENKKMPTIVFFHAPLAGTVLDKEDKPGAGKYVAQPYKNIDSILKDNPQVFLWVSGHTHTPPTKKSFMADFNLYDGRVMNIHNTDLNREKIWTNSYYLYDDRVEIKTFSHSENKWLTEFDRVVKRPVIDK